MKVTVKTIWGGGLVSVATPYVKKAIESGEDLEIELNGAIALVPNAKLKEKKPREQGFKDKFGRQKSYSLYDFFWNDYAKK